MHAYMTLLIAWSIFFGGPDARDKQSVSVTVTGCLQGRDLHVVELLESDDDKRAALIQGKRFRLSAKGSVKDDIKELDRHFVKLSGTIKNSVLDRPGISVGGARIVIGASPMSRDPTSNPHRDPSARTLPMDATALTSLADTCFKR